MSILLYPLATEKNIRQVEEGNKIVFIVDNKATKKLIKKEFSEKYKAKVLKVNILNDSKGRKKAVIKLSSESNALDIASELGVM